MFEVHFRGRNAFEAGSVVPFGSDQLGAWKPTVDAHYECSEEEGKARLAELVKAGIDGREVDGVVPYVVSIELVGYERNGRVRMADTQLWQYAEVDAEVSGPWAHR
jgi:hypothetical protein